MREGDAKAGARMQGDGGYASNLNIVFRSSRLAALNPHGPALMYWMINEDVPALLGPMSDDGLWYLIATKIGADVDPAAIDIPALIRRSTGLDIDVEVVGADPWVARRLIADRYRRGNVLLAGDACHLLKALAVTSPARFPGIEEVPTAAESIPGFSSKGWFGLLGPAGMPETTVQHVAEAARSVLAVPELRARLLQDFGGEVVAGTPAEFRTSLVQDRRVYRELIAQVGASIE